MTEIDKLKGTNLAAAVGRARGWEFRWEDEEWRTPEGEIIDIFDYRPDPDISQAWELDGTGWRWSFREDKAFDGESIIAFERNAGAIAFALFQDHSTKSAAYATARCRAFLKAKALAGSKGL